MRSIIRLIVFSNRAPSRSASSPRIDEHPSVRLPPHPQAPRLASGAGFVHRRRPLRPDHPRQSRPAPHAGPGAPSPHRWSRRPTGRPSRAARHSTSPACAAAAISGSDSNARAVSTVSRTVRSDTPSRAASRLVERAALVQHPRHRQFLHPQAALLAHQLATRVQPARRSPGAATDRDARSRRTWVHPTTGV